jgi:hypothetical protein
LARVSSSITGERSALLHLDDLRGEIMQLRVLQLVVWCRPRPSSTHRPPLSGRWRHLAPTGRSQIGNLAVARLGEGRVPFLLSKHCADGANLVAGLIMDGPETLTARPMGGGSVGGGTLFELFAEIMLPVSVLRPQ